MSISNPVGSESQPVLSHVPLSLPAVSAFAISNPGNINGELNLDPPVCAPRRHQSFNQLLARFALNLDQKSDFLTARLERLEQAPTKKSHAMVRLLARVIGIGVETADMLVREVLSRNLRWPATPV
jgi:hypothetical protein